AAASGDAAFALGDTVTGFNEAPEIAAYLSPGTDLALGGDAIAPELAGDVEAAGTIGGGYGPDGREFFSDVMSQAGQNVTDPFNLGTAPTFNESPEITAYTGSGSAPTGGAAAADPGALPMNATISDVTPGAGGGIPSYPAGGGAGGASSGLGGIL